MKRRDFLKTAVVAGVALPNVLTATAGHTSAAPAKALPMPTWRKLPRWRGFNLLEKFIRQGSGRNPAFREEDFRMIHELGFNFVRLPMDYRTWILDGDRRRFDESVVDEIAQAVDFGHRYGIHVLLNFHRAPGYTVAQPQENPLVWEDAETLEVCALHWNHFARRFRDVSNRRLSFNLFNEPANVEIGAFMRVHRALCDAIRAESPDRLIICDGMSWGTTPTMELAELNVAQATRGYMPMEISHYHTTWAGDYLKNMKEVPTWPLLRGANGMLFAPGKAGLRDEQRAPITISLAGFRGKTRLRLRVDTVSTRATWCVEALNHAGNVTRTLFQKDMRPGPGEGEWERVVFKPEWQCYQNVYNRDYEVEVPAGVRALRIRMEGGDWVSFSQFGFLPEGAAAETVVPATPDWGGEIARLEISRNPDGTARVGGVKQLDREWHRREYVRPWQQWEKLGGVMVGEFGAFNKTPHDVVLAWMTDLMSNWREAGWGWAMWNFRGSIGVLDSGRADCEYVDFHGHRMDRKMMALLQRM